MNIYTNNTNIELAMQMPVNQGIGNCENVAKRVFNVLLSGKQYGFYSNAFITMYETFRYGVGRGIYNCFYHSPSNQSSSDINMYELMLKDINPSLCEPLPEILTMTYYSQRHLEDKLRQIMPFSVLFASARTTVMGFVSDHAFIIVRGNDPDKYFIIDKYNSHIDKLSRYNKEQYFSIYPEFKIEVTGPLNPVYTISESTQL